MSGVANAQSITVEYTTTTCESGTWNSLGQFNAHVPVAITTVADSWRAIRVRPTSGDSPIDIGAVSLSGSRTSASALDLFVVPGCLPVDPGSPILSASGTTLSSISVASAFRDHTRLTAAISGDVTGAIDVGSIYRLQVGGAIAASVTAHSTDPVTGNAISFVSAGSTTSAGVITASTGNIDTLSAAAGGFHGVIQAPEGSIRSITTSGGITIDDAVGITAKTGLRTLSADSTVNANITANANGGSGDVSDIAVTNGDLGGALVANDLVSPDGNNGSLYVAGELSTSLSFRNVFGSISVGSCAPGVVIHASGIVAADGVSTAIIEARDGDLGDVIAEGRIGDNRFDGGPHLVITAPGSIGRIESVHDNLGCDGCYVTIHAGEKIAEIRTNSVEPETTIDIGDEGNDPGRLGVLRATSFHGHGSIRSFDEMRIANLTGVPEIRGGIPSDRVVQIGALNAALGHQDAQPGRLYVTNEQGLAGQVIIDGSNAITPPGGWDSGEVRVRLPSYDLPFAVAQLSPLNLTPDQGPYYERESSVLGGGSVGLVPFHVHDADCIPARNPSQLPPPELDPADRRTFLNSAFAHADGTHAEHPFPPTTITVSFYGPVWNIDSAPPIEIFKANDATGQIASDAVSMSGSMYFDSFSVRNSNSPPFSRDISFYSTPHFPEGLYAVTAKRHHTGGGGTLYSDPVVGPLCANLLNTNNVPVADFTYYFRVLSDCDVNGQHDSIDIEDAAGTMHPIDLDGDGFIDGCEVGLGYCDPDVNHDGNVDQGDVDYLINVVAGGPNPSGSDPDFNHDGNVDQGDSDALLNTVAGGPCP
jgi:hypothetical protein